jgi:hypothetical protein
VGAQRPFGAAKHIERRCSEANRRRCPPDRSRSEGTPSSSERAVRRSKPFWLLFRRLEKVTRRKGGTLSGRYRSNGYVLGPPSKRAKIAAFGSSYRGSSGLQVNPVECPAHCQIGQPHDLLNRQRRVHQWRTVGCQGGISGRPAPTGICMLPARNGLAGRRHREQAHSYRWIGYISWRLVGCQAVFASKLSSYKKREQNAPRFCFSPLNTMSASSGAALDLDPRATSEG